MAKLFANRFNLDALPTPQKPVEVVNQGAVNLKPVSTQTQELATRSVPQRDPFGKTIRLVDRFKQYGEISSTNHLPEYVLSDKNTGYLDRLLGAQRTGNRFVDQAVALRTLQNAGVFKEPNKNYANTRVEQGSTEVRIFKFKSVLGSVESVVKTETILSWTGRSQRFLTIPDIKINKVVSGDRIVDPQIRIQRIDYNEVSVVNNNLILGVTVIPTFTPPRPLATVLTIPNIVIELTSAKSLIVDPKIKIKQIEQVSLLSRGLPQIDTTTFLFRQFITIPRVEIQLTQPIRPEQQAILIDPTRLSVIRVPELRHGSTQNVTFFNNRPDEFLTIPALNFPLTGAVEERDQAPLVNPRNLSEIRNPESRHGSSNIRPQNYEPNRYLNNSIRLSRELFVGRVVDLNSLLINPILNALFVSTLNPNTAIGVSMGQQDLSRYYGLPPRFPYNSVEGVSVNPNEIRPTFTDGQNPASYGNIYDEINKYDKDIAQTSGPMKAASDLASSGRLAYTPTNITAKQSYSPSQNVTPQDATEGWIATHGTGQTNIPGDYKALSYPEIAARRSSATRPTSDFTLSSESTIEPWRTRLGMPDDGTGDKLNSSVNATATDLVKVKVGSLQFRSYITAFNDSYTPNYTDVNYIGRPDTLKVYKSSTRNISLAFKVAAFSGAELKVMYQKLEQLVKQGIMAVPEGLYSRGPMLTLTVGNWVVNAPIILSSLKFDTNPTEYTWDIANEVPHLVDVSLDCVVLASNNGTRPFLTTGNYIGYGA